MPRCRLALLAFAALLASPLAATPVVQRDDLVALCGDSITARRIYTLYLEEYLLLCSPVDGLATVQAGRGFDTAGGFVKRVANDVLPFRPAVATLCFGMNDGKYAPANSDTLEAYRRDLSESIRLLKAGGARVIVAGSPGVVDPAKFKQPRADAATYNATLGRLRDVARDVAATEGILFADIHAPMLEAMTRAKTRFGADYILAGDGIHPNANGHLVIAQAFLKALGFDGDIGTLSIDYSTGVATASDGHRVLGCADGVLRLESTRYPFCFDDISSPFGAHAMAALTSFNAELNRYRLVVANAPARARVTWGKTSREFTAEELAAGVNLADAFPQNPFSEPFFAAAKVMKEQQDFEDQGIRVFLNSLIDWRKELPERHAQIDDLASSIIEKIGHKRAASRAAIKPVVHQLKIEPAQP